MVVVPVLKRRTSQRSDQDIPDRPTRPPEARLEEAVGLTAAIGLAVVDEDIVPVTTIRPATLFGTGKVDELKGRIAARDIELVVVDQTLSPIQQRNLEKAWQAKVLDRTGLILEIFGSRARTREGQLQVELAHLTYQKSRLVRSWTHLERQRGGFGFLGGPGETQIEADRRLLQERIARLEADLQDVKRTRALHRSTRKKVPHPVIALVGYTNAGKSSLFNALTSAEVFAKDLLFATLDPTLRRLKLPHGREVILSDTVGFISDLPTHLVAAFRATLEEVLEADLILHVRDISHADSAVQAVDVEGVLEQLGIDPTDTQRMVEVWNKLDLIGPERRAAVESLMRETPSERRPLLVSARTGEGLDQLVNAIEDRLAAKEPVFRVRVDAADGAGLAWAYAHCEVLERETGADGESLLRLRVPERYRDEVRRRFVKESAG